MNEFRNSFAGGSGVVIARQSTGTRSGDFARAFPHRDGRALLFIGDVSGHDDRAANFASDLEARVSRMAGWMSPGPLLSELNSSLEASSDSDIFVTALCLSLDARTGAGTIAVAGHLPPIGYGDILVAVTDGVTDPLATQVDVLGLAALVAIVARAPRNPEKTCISLLQTAKGFGWPDDATVLAVGRRPYHVPAHRSAILEPTDPHRRVKALRGQEPGQ